MKRRIPELSWRDLWCDFHEPGHLESDYECDLMRMPYDFPEELAAQIYYVTVTRTIEEDRG